MLNSGVVNGEQDQGIPFKGPNASETANSDADKTPELESSEFPKSSMASALRRDSFKDIGQRRRSSASNQPSVNLRRGRTGPCRLLLTGSARVFQG
jgi:hypothetical protein